MTAAVGGGVTVEPVESIEADDGEFVRDDFNSKVSSSFKRMLFIFRNHVVP